MYHLHFFLIYVYDHDRYKYIASIFLFFFLINFKTGTKEIKKYIELKITDIILSDSIFFYEKSYIIYKKYIRLHRTSFVLHVKK